MDRGAWKGRGKSMGWKVDTIPNGFVILSDRNEPVATFEHSTEKEAEAAREHVVAALEGVKLVVGHGSDTTFKDTAGFLTTFGREFSQVLAKAGIDDASFVDCYSALVEGIGTKEITPDKPRAMHPEKITESTMPTKRGFETKRVRASHITKAIKNTLRGKSMGWKVDTIPNGFVIISDRNKPVATFEYSTEEEAEAAREHVIAALEGVRLLVGHGSNRTTSEDWEGFLTVLGEEFSAVLAKAGFDGASGQGCFCSIGAALGTADITADTLRSLSSDQVAEITSATNVFFETKRVKASHVTKAIKNTL